MRFKIDENLPVECCEILQGKGYDAVSVLQEELGGTSDADLISVCMKEQRVLVTLDLDFTDIRSYPPQGSPGIVVLRMRRQDKSSVLAGLRRVTSLFHYESLRNSLWIVEADRVRIRVPPGMEPGGGQVRR